MHSTKLDYPFDFSCLALSSAFELSSRSFASFVPSCFIIFNKLLYYFSYYFVRSSFWSLLFREICSNSRYLLLFTSRIWLFNLSIYSFFSSACCFLSYCKVFRSSPQLLLVFSKDSILDCNSIISLVWDSSSSAAVARVFCMITL